MCKVSVPRVWDSVLFLLHPDQTSNERVVTRPRHGFRFHWLKKGIGAKFLRSRRNVCGGVCQSISPLSPKRGNLASGSLFEVAHSANSLKLLVYAADRLTAIFALDWTVPPVDPRTTELALARQ